MIRNLFVIFDPSTSENLSFNWLRRLIVFILIPINFWLIPSRYNYLWSLIFRIINKEIRLLMVKWYKKVRIIIFLRFIIFIIINNFLGLFSYIFTRTSHLVVSLYLSLSLWLGLIIYGWRFNTNKIFIHLVPLGTPFILMFFIVLIETIRNLIRPITLSVRLSANIIAGHLLIVLLGEIGYYLTITLIFILLIQILLELLELSVRIIQSYVFVILRVLYSNEFIIYEKN